MRRLALIGARPGLDSPAGLLGEVGSGLFRSSRATALAIVASSLVVATCFGVWAYALQAHGVDVPREDQWDVPSRQMLALVDGDLTLEVLAAQHNEARKVFPHLVSLGVFMASGHFDVTKELFVGYGLCAGIVALIGCLAWLSFRALDAVAVITALGCSLLWSAHSLRFHLFSITFERLIPEFLLLLTTTVLLWRGASWAAVVLAGVGAFVAQFSYPGGLVLWGLAILYVILAEPAGVRRNAAKIGLLLALAVASSLAYFAGYRHPGHHSGWTDVLDERVVDMALFLMLFVGNAVTSSRELLAGALGGLLLLAFVGVFVRFLYASTPRDSPRQAAWLVIGGYSVAQGLLALVGRLPMGLHHASRFDYVSHPVYLYVAVVALLLMALPVRTRRWLASIAVVVSCGMTLTLAKPGFWKKLSSYEQRFEYARACFVLARHYEDEDCLDLLYYRSEQRDERLASRSRILRPGMIEELKITSPTQGLVESWRVEDDTLLASGWARPGGAPADAIVARVEPSRIVAITSVGHGRADPLRRPGDPSAAGRWTLEARVPKMGEHACAIRFYAFDNTRGMLMPLQQGSGGHCRD